MRLTKKFQISLLALVAAVPVSTSCGPTETTCADGVGCVPNEGGSGTGGSSGDAGKGGASAGGKGGKGGKGSGGSSDAGGDAGLGGSNGVSGSGMSGAGGEAGGGGGGCDTTKGPTEESCLVSDEFAVFVSPDGDDKNDGTQASPFATLTKAAEAAGGKLVLVCDATYNEHVSITVGARVYGGFKCADWSAEAAKPLFKPTTAGPALKIDGAADELLVNAVNFEVGDAAGAGETALAALVNASPKVTLRAVNLKAGKGKAGADGSLTKFTFPDRTLLDGNSAVGTTAGAAKPYNQCPGGGVTAGGKGGTAQDGGEAGDAGTPDFNGPGGEPGTPGSCIPNGGGHDGANAPDAPAASGANALGTLSVLGWSTGSGGDGVNGSPGQGGGGGASSKTGGGGGGGAGACGGAGAKGGQGGGASIALAVLGSVVKVEASELVTADAGVGGSSVAGQAADGADSEPGFAGNPGPGACQGGAGGLGGNGAAGGGGAGGISVGIVWKGAMAPTVSADTTTTNGKAGAKGVGGVSPTNDGIAGVSQKILALN